VSPAVIVDLEQLVEVVEAAVIAGVGVSIVFSLVIFGAVRAGEYRAQSRPLAAGAHALLAAVALIACFASIVFGVSVMLSK
jgi:hypothetical protein